MKTINWVLVIVIGIMLLCGWKGKKAGFIKAAFSMLSIVFAIMGAMFLESVVEALFSTGKIMSYILAFVVVSIALAVVCAALDIAAKLPVLHEINEIAGFFVGLVEGLLDVWVLFVVLDFFSKTQWGRMILDLIHSSQLLSIIYENNLLWAVWNLL